MDDSAALLEERLRDVERLLQEKETELEQRDRTVQQLTESLSATVEKLDRAQRAGCDRGGVKVTGPQSTFPKEVVEQQTELVDDLQRAVQMWEDMQIAAGFGRFEMQIADLQALYEEHFREPEIPTEPETSEAETEEESESDLEETADEGISPEPTVASEVEATPEPDSVEICPLRPPEILNLSEADEESLQRCVEQQDTYIDYLTARLQRVAEKKTAVDWKGLRKDPEKLKNQLTHTATKIQQSRHLAEFELALQRTRLKRQERELKKLSEELESQMQNLDLESADEHADKGGRRWMRALGMGKNGETE